MTFQVSLQYVYETRVFASKNARLSTAKVLTDADGLVQEICNSSASAMELRLPCTKKE